MFTCFSRILSQISIYLFYYIIISPFFGKINSFKIFTQMVNSSFTKFCVFFFLFLCHYYVFTRTPFSLYFCPKIYGWICVGCFLNFLPLLYFRKNSLCYCTFAPMQKYSHHRRTKFQPNQRFGELSKNSPLKRRDGSGKRE